MKTIRADAEDLLLNLRVQPRVRDNGEVIAVRGCDSTNLPEARNVLGLREEQACRG